MTYDPQNLFAKILREEIPCDRVYEDDYVLSFPDIAPQAATHILVIPKGEYVSIHDFGTSASADEVKGFYAAIAKIAEQEGLSENGYRVICNTGAHGGQEVPHFHAHILGGEVIGKLVSKG